VALERAAWPLEAVVAVAVAVAVMVAAMAAGQERGSRCASVARVQERPRLAEVGGLRMQAQLAAVRRA
jgi:hypothetical protein